MVRNICKVRDVEYVPNETYENVSRIIACLEKELKSGVKQT